MTKRPGLTKRPGQTQMRRARGRNGTRGGRPASPRRVRLQIDERRSQLLEYRDKGVVVGTYLIDEPNLVKRWGIISPAMRADEMDAARINRVLEVNVTGTLLCSKAAIRCSRRCPGSS